MRYKLPFLILAGISVSLSSPHLSLRGQDASPSVQPRSGEEALVLGQSPNGEAPQNLSRKTGSFKVIIQMIAVLGLCAGAIYGAVFFLKRIARPPETQDPYLKVLAAAHLGSNRFVHVVSVGSQAWLVGASEGGVSLIAEIADPETVDAMLLASSRKTAVSAKSPDFSRLLSRFTGKDAAPQPDLNAENVRKRRERLRGL
ncbi:MAG: flagellar biosynthetic protein FliO [Spirochaetaceae bacterium]|nr:flagellar biosynthetic protein FliO [Spirochaetaceae bacterium]